MNERFDSIVMGTLVVLALVLLGMVIWPFAPAFFVAAVFAGALSPVHLKLSQRLRNRRSVAAGILVLATLLAFILPIGSVTALMVKEAIEVITFVRNTLRDSGVEGLLARMPHSLRSVVQWVIESLPNSEQQLQSFAGQGASAAAAVGGVLSATGKIVLQTVLMLIALFFLLTDGESLVYWLSGVIPSKRFKLVELLQEFRRVSVAVLVSTVVTAGTQSLVALVGFLIARAPNVLFFCFMTFFFAFIPAVGAAAVPVLLSVLLFLSGRTYAAVFLFLWGLLAVGLVDNIVKPLLIKGGLELHGAIVFFSLLGGIAAFGAVGFIAGPVIVVFFLAVVRMSLAKIDVVPTEVAKRVQTD